MPNAAAQGRGVCALTRRAYLEKLLGAYPEELLFGQPGRTPEELLWHIFNEYMRDTYRVKVSSVMVQKFGSNLRVTKKTKNEDHRMYTVHRRRIHSCVMGELQ